MSSSIHNASPTDVNLPSQDDKKHNCCSCEACLRLLEEKDVRVKELEDELKEAKETIRQLMHENDEQTYDDGMSPEEKEHQEEGMRRKMEKDREEKEFNEKVKGLLTGNLAVLQERVQTKEGVIFFENYVMDHSGFLFSFEDFEQVVQKFHGSDADKKEFLYLFSVIQDPLWILMAKDYEVRCMHCEGMFSLTNIHEDGTGRCPSCCRKTFIGKPQDGHKWSYVNPCGHIQQCKHKEWQEKCFLCGENVARVHHMTGPFDEYRIPRKKKDQ